MEISKIREGVFGMDVPDVFIRSVSISNTWRLPLYELQLLPLLYQQALYSVPVARNTTDEGKPKDKTIFNVKSKPKIIRKVKASIPSLDPTDVRMHR